MDDDVVFLSIAIPTYNNALTLKYAVESCLTQTDLTDCEILLVDNASTDETTDVIATFQSHYAVRSIRNEKTVAMYDNHNICLENAHGRYVLFCHADDTLDEQAISILKSHLKSRDYPKRYVCWGHSLFRDYSAMLRLHGYSTGQLFAGERAAAPFLVGGLTPSGTCYSRDMINYGGFIKSTHRLAQSDSSTMVYLALKGFRFEMIPQLLFFRTHASTAVAGISTDEKLASYCDTYTHLHNRLDDPSFRKLLQLAGAFQYPPFLFFYYMASLCPKAVLRELLKYTAKRPSALRNPLYLKVFGRIVSSWQA